MTRTIEVERCRRELSWRWRTRWYDEIGYLHIGYGFTRRGAIKSLRRDVEKEMRRRSAPPESTSVEVDW